MEIKKIGVVGAGTMGNGIAQVAALIGCEVIMRDVEERFVQNGLKNIDRFLSKSVEKGKMTEDQKQWVLGRIKGTVNMADLAEVDFVIEAVIEDMDLKRSVFKDLDGICRADVILATNTSPTITEIAAATQVESGGHAFLQPVPDAPGGGQSGIPYQ
jgi:3-hydroxybutyryl-CoA dehydrogenase